MKAVARLVCTFFTGTPALLAFTLGGLILFAIDVYILLTRPHAGDMLWIAIVGVIAFFIGSSLMPVTFGRLARGHAIGLYPHGRVKLLASAFITTLAVALPAGVAAPAAFVSDMSTLPEIMDDPRARMYVLQLSLITFTSGVIVAGWLYLAMWFWASERNMAGICKGLLVVMLMVFAPAKEISNLSVSLTENLMQIAAVWAVFGTGFLLWPRFKVSRARHKGERFAGLTRALSSRTAGREFDLLLGTSNPWLLIMALALPLIFATRYAREAPQVWLYFLTIYSTVAGAYSGQAAERSRALWLRGDWSRDALFAAVERSYWRHNAHILGALLVLALGIGLNAGFSTTLLLSGLPLLVLGTALSTYLGLAVTRGLRWLDMVAGSGVMVSLMLMAAFVASKHPDLPVVFALEAGLVLLVWGLRLVARRRWTQIDWMLCRPDRAPAARGA